MFRFLKHRIQILKNEKKCNFIYFSFLFIVNLFLKIQTNHEKKSYKYLVVFLLVDNPLIKLKMSTFGIHLHIRTSLIYIIHFKSFLF